MSRLDARETLLNSPGPSVNGRAVADVAGVPPHLRGMLITQLHVLCRLRGESPPLDTADEVERYLERSCGGLLTALRTEWWEGDALRASYSKQASSAWLHAL